MIANVQEILYSTLSADGDISGLVGDRLYPNFMPQDNIYPAVVFRRSGNEHLSDLKGRGITTRTAFQFDIYAKTYSEIIDIRAAILSVLDGSLKIWHIDDFDNYEDDVQLHHGVLEIEIWQQ